MDYNHSKQPRGCRETVLGKIIQSNWSIAFWSIIKQQNLFPDITFHRIMTRTILRKFISRKCKRAHMWCALQFGTICPIIKHKNTYGDTLNLVKITGWSAASLKLTLLPKWCKLSQIQNKAYFRLFWLVFIKFPEN